MAAQQAKDKAQALLDVGAAHGRKFIDTGAAQGRKVMEKVAGSDFVKLLVNPEDAQARTYEKITHKDDFHEKRWRCITRPDRALETLAPYACLELKVHAGRNLLPRESWTKMSLTDPGVSVWLDDVKLEATSLIVPHTTNPLWRHEVSVDIVSPLSMVRLQVFDEQITQEIDQGFVEFCVGDIPYDKVIRGWFELRFQENLKNDSIKRYASHCAMREDVLDVPETGDAAATNAQSSTTSSNLPTHLVNDEAWQVEKRARRMVAIRAVQRTRTMLHACSHGCASKAGYASGSRGPSASAEMDRGNAGEVYVELKLVKLVATVDSIFALALPMPPQQSFGDYVLEEDEKEVERKKGRKLDLQKCMDTVHDLKVRALDDFLLCIFYYVKYIGTWRMPMLSLPIFLGSCFCCIESYFGTMVWPAMLSAIIFLNGWESLRKTMTRGGLNAPLNDEGFELAASWRNSGEMYQFVKRVVEQELVGTVTDVAKLHNIAAQCFRDGAPIVTLQELKDTLKAQKDLITYTQTGSGDFVPGDKVLVDDREKAIVKRVAGDGLVFLEYEDDARSPKGQDDPTDRVPEWPPVPQSRLRRRQKLPFYQTWLLPTKITNIILDLMETVGKIERSALYPIIDLVTEVVTWQKKGAALLLCVVLILVSIGFVVVEYAYVKPGLQVNRVHEDVSWWIITSIKAVNEYLDNVIAFVLVFVVLIVNANWFQAVKSVFRIVGRKLSEKRHAPAHWSFFRADQNMQEKMDLLDRELNADSRWNLALPPNIAKFHSNMKQAHEGMRGRAAADLERLQRKISELPGLGLTTFKLPDLTHPSNNKAPTTST